MSRPTVIRKDTLTDIGDAIREKTETTELIPTIKMAQYIRDIETLPTDATAVSEDLLAGKVAYNNDGRFVGSIEEFDGGFEGGESGENIEAFYVPLLINRNIENPPLSDIEIIGERTFCDCLKIEEIEIPGNVKGIGEFAFSDCINLKNVKLSEGLENIRYGAFNKCNNLTSITIPNSVEWIGSSIGKEEHGGPFLNCESLEEIVFDGNESKLKYIGSYAFANLKKLKTIDLPIVEYVQNYAFAGCGSLETIGLLSEWYIGDGIFEGCTNLKTAYITALEWIGSGIFSGCYNLQHVSLTVPDDIPNYFLQNRKELRFVDLSEVTSIGASAFEGCNNLTSITIPDSVLSIGARAFAFCNNLKNITIPSSVNYIYHGTLLYTASLESLTIPFLGNGTNAYHLGWIFGVDNTIQDIIDYQSFYVPKSLKKLIITNDILAEDILFVDYPFYGCKYIEQIEIPDNPTVIGKLMFNTCESLIYNVYENGKYLGNSKNPYVAFLEIIDKGVTTINIHPNTTTLGIDAFNSCTSLISIKIPNNVKRISMLTFAGCNSLENITIPGSVKIIDFNAFYNCNNLENVYYEGTIEQWCNTSIYSLAENPMIYAEHFYMLNDNDEWHEATSIEIPENVKEIGGFIFSGFTNLTNITIPNSVTSIGDGAFYNCSSLTNITIPNSVTIIGDRAFSNCSSLESITIPEGVTIIDEYTFAYCSNLESIIIPYGVTSIGKHAFRDCSSLTSIEIPDSVTTINNYAFESCTSLTSVVIPDSVTSIGEGAFSDCTLLEIVEIGESVSLLKDWVFDSCNNLKSIYLKHNNVVSIQDAFYKCNGVTVHVVASILNDYLNDETWKQLIDKQNFTIVGDL